MKKILKTLGTALLSYLGSKKALAFYGGAAVIVGNHLLEALGFGLVLGPEAETKFVALAGSYLVGQGLADNGKEANKVHAVVEREKIAAVKEGYGSLPS